MRGGTAMISTRRLWTMAMLVFLLGGLVSCQQAAKEPRSGAIEISGAGATFPAPLYKKWIEEYEKANKDVAITYKGVGSGEGIKRFVNNEVDFGASDAAMTDEQMAKVDRGVKLIPATAGIVVLAYNLKGVKPPLKLSRELYVDIFSGKIEKWNDPRIQKANPGVVLPAKDIILVVRQDSSGTTFAFTNHLSAVSTDWRDKGPGVGKLVEWPAKAMVARGNEGVAGRIKISEGAIGYAEFGYADRAGLSMAQLENKSGNFVEPSPLNGRSTLENTASEMPHNLRLFLPDPAGKNSYPIVTYSWLMLYGKYPDTQKSAALKQFVDWGISTGQEYGPHFGYCPLPHKVADKGRQALAEIP